MAEAALIGVANSVLKQLSSPAFKEIILLWNFDKDLKKLQETIETITNYLHDAEQRESKESVVRGWLFRLRAVLYEADDLFDAIAYKALHEKTKDGNVFMKKVRLFCSKSNPVGFIVKTAHDVKDLRERIDGIYKDMLPFLFQSQRIEDNPIRLHNREETHSFVKVEEVIGRDRERDEIIRLLLPEDNREEGQSLSVVSIIGFGGLGKTTLAQLVYNDERVQSGFDMCVWACINYLSDLNQVLGTILASIPKSKPGDKNLEQLQRELRESIEGKKYLLVLDDVWDENASNWLKLKTLLTCGKNGCKILVTARSTEVAQCLDAVKPYYQLSVLSKESAWGLFVKMAFEEGELSNSDPGLVLLGKQIVKKCGYVPLALVAIGRMLRYRQKEINSWQSFVDKELPEVLLGDDVDKVKLMQVLKVSYNYLPSALKHCFAYCSLFPKDYKFRKDELVRLWIAQGFIAPHGKKSLEEVGDDCFFHMVDRCFFQEVAMSSEEGCLGYTCKMHDLLHDLAIQVAGKDLLGRSTNRHISVERYSDFIVDYSGMSPNLKTLRTVVLHDSSAQLTTESLSTFLASFKVLRVLNLSRLKFEQIPDSIGKLIHLRYLDLSRNSELKFLPDSICKLHLLQTLILEGCEGLNELPSNLGKLVSLRHLIVRRCRFLRSLPSGLAASTSLVTLDGLMLHCSGDLRYLGQRDNFCGTITVELPREGWSNCIEYARKSNMSKKYKPNGMFINWETSSIACEMAKKEAKAVLDQLEPNENLQYLKIRGYIGDTLSNWFSSLSNLKELVLYDCSLEYLADASCVRSGGSRLFLCLEILEMRSLRNLKGWWRELGDNAAMSTLPCLPRVSKVVIDNCPNLMDSMPLFGGTIEDLKIREVNGKLLSKLLSTTPNISNSSECHHYTNLQVLRIQSVTNLECLPEGWIRHLTALKSLVIQGCKELRLVSSCGLAYLTSLETLTIQYSGILRLENKDDEKMSAEEMNNNGLGIMPWKALQRRLCELQVPWQSHLLEGLQYLTSLEELRIGYYEGNQVEVDNEDMEGRGLLCKLGLMERLHTLYIHFAEIRCNFPMWIQYLRCVKKLTLWDCKELMNMSWGILANMNLLRSLKLFYIRRVSRSSVVDWVVEQQTQFNSLAELDISHAEDGEWIHDIPWNLLPSLRILRLERIENLRSIPDGIQHLTSLQQLSIEGCEKIDEIPNWMINLTSLQRLEIRWCSPALKERCKPETGVDWHLISHIHITIY